MQVFDSILDTVGGTPLVIEYGTSTKHFPGFAPLAKKLLASVEFPWDIRPIIRSHHEKLDGSGYPDRLRGDEIPLSAQLICIVDVYDALTTTRSYRGAMQHQEAVDEIVAEMHEDGTLSELSMKWYDEDLTTSTV